MPAVQRYQVDVFAIIMLIAAVLIMVFLIIVAIYFFNLMNLNPPSRTESTFLFWTTVVLAIIFLGIIIYALYHIFTYTVTFCEEPRFIPPVTPIPVTVTAPTPPPVVITRPLPPQEIVTQSPAPILYTSPSNFSTSFSDTPVPLSQRVALNQEVLSIGDAIGGA